MKSSYDTSDFPSIPDAEVAILQAEWHIEHSDMMVKHCSAILEQAGVAKIHHHVLPGTLELPLAARDVSRSTPSLEAIILFGIVIKGDTHHFEMILDTVARGIERVTFEENLPVINEIIPATNLQQVIARTSDDSSNKGREAALAAIKTIAWRRSLRENS